MTGHRRLIQRHRALATWLVAAALVLKLLVPAGFMPVMTNGMLTIEICTGQGVRQMAVAIPGLKHDQPQQHPAKGDMPCAFAALVAPVLGAIDPFLLAVLLALIVVLGLRPLPDRIRPRPPRLRPPLRGPPISV